MKARLTLFLALLLLCTGAALATTPDGETPSEETVCDGESGAAYGLCNAYCEAMDCDSDEAQASATACTKVRDKFTNITGRDLPCEAPPVTCPCLGDPTFARIASGSSPISSCQTEPASGSADGIFVTATGPFGDDTSYSATFDGSQWSCGNLPNINILVTPAEGLYCAQLLEQAANNQSVSCVAP